MKSMPLFSAGDYKSLLKCLQHNTYPILPVSSLADPQVKKGVFLRHDVDFSLECALPLGELEAQMGFKGTYYILLNGPYSPRQTEERKHLKALARMGHEIGLHYDMRHYPTCPDKQVETLKMEVAELESLTGSSVTTISMHEPHRGHGDPFRELHWVHPHNPAWFEHLTYVSDSCRAWRDESLLQFFHSDGPQRLLLLTHPELWLDGRVHDRLDYLNNVLIPRMPKESLPYFQEEVPAIWMRHAGAAAHDLRTSMDLQNCRAIPIDRSWTKDHMNDILPLFQDSRFLPWGEREILMDVPGKWEESFALFEGGELKAISFNSVREERTYIHAIISHREHRKRGYGSLLLRALQLNAIQKGRGGIRLCVSDDNPSAKAWYESHNFSLIQQDPENSQVVLQWVQP
jgi:ribosomal protein S18 acetylase RimI-like enzyme